MGSGGFVGRKRILGMIRSLSFWWRKNETEMSRLALLGLLVPSGLVLILPKVQFLDSMSYP